MSHGQDFSIFVETNDPSNKDIRLTRMVLDPNNGRLYVGSVNRLYKLTSDLETEKIESTGPRDDNPNCIPPDFVLCHSTLVSTNNINKILVIDTDNSQLITCGNVYRGSCETRDMDTLDLIEWYDRQVATTATDGSTVAIIAHGPNNDNTGLGPNVLYVGRSGIPGETRWIPLSSRLLPSSNNEDSFSILNDEIGNAGLVQVKSDFFGVNSDFNIDYISVFESNGFTYYVSVQPKIDTITSGPFVTKIVQICQSCNKYKETYIDLPLVCKSSDGVDYNLAQSAYVTQAGDDLAENMNLDSNDNKDIVVVSFAEAEGTSKIPTDKSAVCIYSIKKIREKFFDWLYMCASDINQPTGCAWSSTALEDVCGNTWLADVIGVDLCACRDFGKMTCGTLNITETPCHTSSDSMITAVAALSHAGHTVIFTGNQDGHLKKLKVVNSNSALEYENIKVVHDNPEIVQNGLLFDAENNNIYVMSKRQITKVPVENCENFTTCNDCLGVNGVGDPYCGWCTLENRCSRWNVCQGHIDRSTNRWIADFQCPSVDVYPSTVYWERMALLTLNVTSLPQSLTGFKCVFDTIGTTNATPTGESNVLTCTTPPPSNIPSPGSRGFIKVKLSILSVETNEKFVSTNFYFCDCDSLKTCMTCTENNCGCDWCVFENICSKDVSSCKIEGVVRGNANEANSSQQCPQIKESAETLIPVDLSAEIYVVGENFPQPLDGQTGYECILHIEGAEVITTGERESSESIKCRSFKYMYSEDVISKLVTLQLKWNNDFEIDNPDNVQVNLYKCDVGRSNCGKCQQAELKYQCGWCNSVNEQKCTVINKCNPRNSWLTSEEICPNPTITKIKPEAGPIEGGTRLTIMGYNLGKNVSHVKNVDVAGLGCLPQSDGYRIAEQVQCLTSASNGVHSGHVSITIGNNLMSYSGVSTGQFSYVVVKIYNIFPMKGAQSGGTKVTVVGENMNAGSNITATIAGLKCYVTE
ncbi:plexin-A2-like [Saccoglossus kowalevskii]